MRPKPWSIHFSTYSLILGIESVLWTLFYNINTLRPRQNDRHFPDDIFKCIFLNEDVWIALKISLKFVLKVRINNIPALVQIMAWRRPGDKPLSETMMVSLPTHICVTRPQWVKVTSDECQDFSIHPLLDCCFSILFRRISQELDCLFNSLLMLTSKRLSKLRCDRWISLTRARSAGI